MMKRTVVTGDGERASHRMGVNPCTASVLDPFTLLIAMIIYYFFYFKITLVVC